MKNLFRGYYRPTEEELAELWSNCLFVPDANVILNLYRYSERTREELMDIFRHVSDRLWLPHQAALEYQRNRLWVLAKQIVAHEEITEFIGRICEEVDCDLRRFSWRSPLPVHKWSDIIIKALDNVRQELEEREGDLPDLFAPDPLRDEIDELFDDKVGSPYSPEQLEMIIEEGEKRYEAQMPPGYMDAPKGGERQFGDFIVWKQIIDKVRETRQPVIFITDDGKEDWWQIVMGRTIGPRPELVEEYWSEVGALVNLYKTDQFMFCARTYLGDAAKVDDEAIGEVHAAAERFAQDVEVAQEQIVLMQKIAEIRPGLRAYASEKMGADFNPKYSFSTLAYRLVEGYDVPHDIRLWLLELAEVYDSMTAGERDVSGDEIVQGMEAAERLAERLG